MLNAGLQFHGQSLDPGGSNRQRRSLVVHAIQIHPQRSGVDSRQLPSAAAEAASIALLQSLRQDLGGPHGTRADTMLVTGSVVDAQLEKLDIDVHQGASKTFV